MAVGAGSRLGVYDITGLIGEGGMGQVFLATDTRLKRQVAIKLLPESFAADPGRLARFQREAELLAQLNHPHIAQIFGLDAHGQEDRPFIVMELVDGETLADRVRRGPVPIGEALHIARQIADALEAAHDRGIVHRDLKPANIKVRGDGTVKVLDFGLARATDSKTISGGAPSALTESPTLASPAMTAAGVIIGTAAYMSPEQARGAIVDRGADLWAFGAIVMELLTGAQLFGGATVSDMIASVLARDIQWDALPPETPPAVRRLLRRCLERDRRKRLADAGAAKLEIDDAIAGISDAPREPESTRTMTPARTVLRIVVPTAIAASLLAGGIVWSLVRRPAAPASRVVLSITPPEGVRLNEPGTMASPPLIAPDGSAVLYASRAAGAVFVRRLDTIDTIKIPNTVPANEAFWHGSSRVVIPVLDGTARRLLEVRLPDGAPETVAHYSANVRGGSWSVNGNVLLGGTPPLTWDTRETLKRIAPDAGRLVVLYPQFFGDGDDFLALFDTEDEPEIGVAALRGGKIVDVKLLLKNGTAAAYTPADGGRLLFVRNDNLYSQRFDRRARAVDGEAELVVRGVASQPTLARADFSVAENGAIAWRPGHASLSQVVVRDRSGARIATAGPPSPVASISLAPAGDRVLVDDLPHALVTVGEAGREKLPGDVQWRGWSAAGRVIGSRADELVALAADGRTVERLGTFAEPPFGILVLSPDGQFVIGRARGRAAWARISAMQDAAAWTPLAQTDTIQEDVSFSPDGRWIVYGENNRVYVQPFPGPGARRVIAASGIDPVWRGDGREIVFLDDGVSSVTVSGSGSSLTFGAPVRLFGGIHRAYGAVAQSTGLAIAADGSRIFTVEGLEQPESNVIDVMIPGAAPR